MSNWLPSLKALRAFEAVSRHLNYRKAAEELKVSPGAANQLVSKLEDAIGAPLLERKGKCMVLTPIGVAGRDGLALPFQQIADTVERMRIMSNSTRRLIVSTTPSFASSWLVPRLVGFRVKNPGVEILIDSTPELIEIGLGIADVAIRFGAKGFDEDLIVHRLFDEELSALCSPSLAKGPPKITQLEDLENANLLRWDLSHFEWATNTRKWNRWKYWLDQQGANHIKPGEGIRFSDYNLAVQSAIAGHGFIIGSTPILKDLVNSKLLVNPFSRGVKTDIGYDLVTTEVAASKTEVTTFIDWILEEVSFNSINDPGISAVGTSR